MTDTITRALSEGIEFVHQLGFQSFKKDFVALFEDSNTNLKSEDIAQCHYLIANIYSLHEAPQKAMEYYLNALKYRRDFFDAKLEIAEIHAQLGNYSQALHDITELKAIKERLPEVLELEEDIRQLKKENQHALYKKGDLIWEMCEQIANENFDIVVDTLEASQDPLELQVLARAFGGINDIEGYLSLWQELSETKRGEIAIDFADWFYMPAQVLKDHEIWMIFKDCLTKISEDSFFVVFESLVQNYPKISLIEQRKLTCDYYIALFSNDKDALRTLQNRYPKCEELSMQIFNKTEPKES